MDESEVDAEVERLLAPVRERVGRVMRGVRSRGGGGRCPICHHSEISLIGLGRRIYRFDSVPFRGVDTNLLIAVFSCAKCGYLTEYDTGVFEPSGEGAL